MPGSIRNLSLSLLVSLLILSLVSAVAVADSAQDQREKVKITTLTGGGAVVEIGEFIYIPEATEPCTREESEWWAETRNAGNGMFLAWKKHDKKSTAALRAKFVLLLYEGRQKQYRVPLKDRPSQILFHAEPGYSYAAEKNRVTGTVYLSVEYRADGLVGEVQVTKGLGFGLDENAVQALRQFIFLPAVRDGAFVPEHKNLKITFSRHFWVN
jgi:TonB family protein